MNVIKRMAQRIANQFGRTDTSEIRIVPELVQPISPKLAPRPRPAPAAPKPYVKRYVDVGRNDPCPCGSGAKYKRCCWKKRSDAISAAIILRGKAAQNPAAVSAAIGKMEAK